MSGDFRSGIIFQQINPWTGSTSPWTGWVCSVHRGPTLARTDGTAARSPELGLRPLWCTEARRWGRKRERGTWGTQWAAVWRPGDGEELAAGRKVGDRGARVSGEGESELGRCGEVRGWFSPFYRGRAPGEEFRNGRRRGLKGGMNSGCKLRLRPGLRRGNGQP
jgi:hypothetical protein